MVEILKNVIHVVIALKRVQMFRSIAMYSATPPIECGVID